MEFNKEQFKENLSARLRRQYGKDISQANKHDLFDAVSASAIEIIMPNWMATRAEYDKKPVKQLYYLSAEFLMACLEQQPYQRRNQRLCKRSSSGNEYRF